MSCYETHKGVLKKVDTDNARQYLFDLTENNDFLDKNYSLLQAFYDSDLGDKYIIIKDDLYEWLSHECKYDEEDDFCNLIETQDKTISVHAQIVKSLLKLNKQFLNLRQQFRIIFLIPQGNIRFNLFKEFLQTCKHTHIILQTL